MTTPSEKDRLLALTISPATSPSLIKEALNILEGQVSSEKPQEWLDERGAMKYAGGIGRSCLWGWRTKNNLPSFKVNGRRLFRATDIDAFIIEQAGGDK